jgi:hypothetical protein
MNELPAQMFTREETLAELRKLDGRRVLVQDVEGLAAMFVEGILRAPTREQEAEEECGNYWAVEGDSCSATIFGYVLGESEWIATGTVHPDPATWGRALVIHGSDEWGYGRLEIDVSPLDEDQAPEEVTG